RAEHGLRLALLAVALDDEPGQRARQEHQLVPVRDGLEHRESAHPVPAEFGLHVDVVDHLGREDAAVPEGGPAAIFDRAHQVCARKLRPSGPAEVALPSPQYCLFSDIMFPCLAIVFCRRLRRQWYYAAIARMLALYGILPWSNSPGGGQDERPRQAGRSSAAN